jgi:diguanylate cyclase (GGDEF)-like protein
MILFTNIILLILEPISFIADTVGNPFVHFVNYAMDFLLLLFSTMITGFWASYIDYKMFKKRKRLVKRIFYQHTTMIMLILLIINFFTPILFDVDLHTNTYERGYLFGIRYLIIFSLYIYILIMLISNRTRKNYRVIIGVLMFLLFPILGALLQVFEFEIYFQFTGLALGVFVVFMFLETTSGNKDFLTGLYSRRVLDEYLDGLVETKAEFTVVMIDLDYFKEINDQFGHGVGDEVLIEFSILLIKTKQSKKSLITRLGGDEFLCILQEEDHQNPKAYIKKLYKSMKQHSLLNKHSDLSFSYGLLIYDQHMTTDQLLRKADTLMYNDKNAKR